MPEGAEVRRWSEELDDTLPGRTIERVQIKGGRYVRVDPKTLGLDRLENARIDRVSCKGKLIVFHMKDTQDNPFAILSTLGMTGWWEVDRVDYSLDIEKHCRIVLHLGNAGHAKFYDPRNFGTIKVVSYDEMKRKLKELGPNIMDPRSLDTQNYPLFVERLKRFGKRLTVAEALLDQRIAAGCGNYIRADAMYLAKLSPHLGASELTETQMRAIWQAMYDVAMNSYDSENYEPTCYGRATSMYGSPIEHYTDKHGRTVWWCPKDIT